MDKTDASPDDYFASLPDEFRPTMQTLDALIVAAMPERSRTLWGGTFWGGTEQTIIGYGDTSQQSSKGDTVEWFIVGLARQKRYYSVYVTASENGAYLTKTYADRLGQAKIGASSIGFARLEDVNLDALAELVAHANRVTP